MHSVYPNPPPTPNPTPPSPPTTQPTDTHIDLQGGEKSYMRGDVETMGRRRKQHQATIWAVCGGEQKQRSLGGWWWDNGDSQKEGDCRLPFLHGPRTMPILWLGGARCALGEIQDKRKHQGRTMVFTLFTKDAFPSAAGRMHTESPSAASASYHTSRPQRPFSSKASVTAVLQEDRLGFWPSTSNPCLLHFPKHSWDT